MTDSTTGALLAPSELATLNTLQAAPSGPPEIRFLQKCMLWQREWIIQNADALTQNRITASQNILFVFSESLPLSTQALHHLGGQATSWYAGTYSEDACGIVLVTENFQAATCIDDQPCALNAVFDRIKEHLDKHHTFAIACLSKKQLMVHHKGQSVSDWLAHPTAFLLGNPATSTVTRQMIDQDVSDFHDEQVKHPQGWIASLVWKGRENPYELKPAPERQIQCGLLLTLRNKYAHLSVLVDEEVKAGGGRADIRVTQTHPPGNRPSHTKTMLELKVLSAKKSNTANEKWAQSGINQAKKYEHPGTDGLFACIFDARKDQSDQYPSLATYAKGLQVDFRLYPMIAPPPKTKAAPKKATQQSTKKGAKGRRNLRARR